MYRPLDLRIVDDSELTKSPDFPKKLSSSSAGKTSIYNRNCSSGDTTDEDVIVISDDEDVDDNNNDDDDDYDSVDGDDVTNDADDSMNADDVTQRIASFVCSFLA